MAKMLKVRNAKNSSITKTITEETWQRWVKKRIAKHFRIIERFEAETTEEKVQAVETPQEAIDHGTANVDPIKDESKTDETKADPKAKPEPKSSAKNK